MALRILLFLVVVHHVLSIFLLLFLWFETYLWYFLSFPLSSHTIWLSLPSIWFHPSIMINQWYTIHMLKDATGYNQFNPTINNCYIICVTGANYITHNINMYSITPLHTQINHTNKKHGSKYTVSIRFCHWFTLWRRVEMVYIMCHASARGGSAMPSVVACIGSMWEQYLCL